MVVCRDQFLRNGDLGGGDILNVNDRRSQRNGKELSAKNKIIISHGGVQKNDSTVKGFFLGGEGVGGEDVNLPSESCFSQSQSTFEPTDNEMGQTDQNNEVLSSIIGGSNARGPTRITTKKHVKPELHYMYYVMIETKGE